MKRRAPAKVVDISKAAEVIRAGEVPQVRMLLQAQRGDGGLSFVMSDGSEDRYGDTVAPTGWKTDAFLKNPVFLWQHDRGLPPIGKVGSIAMDGATLRAKDVTFTPSDLHPFGAQIGKLYEAGFLNAVSVGFMPVKYSFNDSGGIDFQEQELLELSAVTVPANANALLEARAKGLLDAEQLKAFGVAEPPPAEEPLAEVLALAAQLEKHAATTERLTVVTEKLAAAIESLERSFEQHLERFRLTPPPAKSLNAGDLADAVLQQINR